MAKAGLRFDRFYANGPVCSPTRASVLTGRAHHRTGVRSHGYALHLQEPTISVAMQKAGYATGHFGKWHLNGIRGPGVPALASDAYHPGRFDLGTRLSPARLVGGVLVQGVLRANVCSASAAQRCPPGVLAQRLFTASIRDGVVGSRLTQS